ncbi:putative GTD-binding domain-containing protein [Dioscorea sansibarensis]
MINKLRKALEEEQDACAALYVELEKDRSAAETAADEAMSMILKLQEEKAELEMEARQNERMVEEKNAYIEQEMELLKEIIVEREKEKLALEKELESSSFDLDAVAKMMVDDDDDDDKKKFSKVEFAKKQQDAICGLFDYPFLELYI